MATKENITFQRGMLKSIQTRVTTLASILFLILFCSPSFRRWVVSVTCADLTTVRAESHRLTYTESLHHYDPFILFSCRSSPTDAFSLLLCLLLTAREGKPLLNYFPSPHFPTPQIVSPPSTTSSRKSICARGGTL